MKNTPELLAPAGHVESFHAALENGADAVYLGLKQLSARATATNFSLEELSALVPYAHKRKRSVYVAINSLVTAPELLAVLDMLKGLSDLQVDALIVQDPAFFALVRRFFPKLRLHASTLMTIHNHAGVNQLARMGASRVVLARELDMGEIGKISEHSPVELEVFVHGALCFSFSGLCMTSSFRGGHSGLQGRCVQPCRLRFSQGRQEGFFLSCNDFCALQFIPELKKMKQIASLKIEGRMKPADYIARVVKAYRMVIDAPRGEEAGRVAEAMDILAQSPSRRLTAGFLGENFSAEVLTPHRSGSSGLWIGTVKALAGSRVTLNLRRDVAPGDRLRPETKEGKEKDAFTVSGIFSREGKPLSEGKSGETVLLDARGVSLSADDRLFKVGSKAKETSSSIWSRIRKEVKSNLPFSAKFHGKSEALAKLPIPGSDAFASEATLILKVSNPHFVIEALQQPQPKLVMLTATRSNLERVAQLRMIPAQKKRFIWSLPVLVPERDTDYYRSALKWFREKGFLTWELNSWAHFDLLGDPEGLNLIGGYRFNARNAAAVAELVDAGCSSAVLSIEITRDELRLMAENAPGASHIVTVHTWPPLFLSKLIPKLHEDKPFLTPRKDLYFFRKRAGFTYIYGDKPMNWFEFLPELRGFGFRHFLIDASEGPEDSGKQFRRLTKEFFEARTKEPHSLFNYERKPTPEPSTETKRPDQRRAGGYKGRNPRRKD
ncbi:MAG: peptidase U32 family protein [Acidobacteriota bacterium]